MKLALAISAVWLFMAAEAQAQRRFESQTGSSISIPKRAQVPDWASDKDRARIVMSEFARCTLDRSPKQVEALLRLPFGAEYQLGIGKVASSECLGGDMLTFQSNLLRGALFTELWRRRAVAESRAREWGPILPSYDLTADVSAADSYTRVHVGLLWFADCIVKKDRAAASDLLTAPIASKRQDEAYARLVPHLSPCLPKNQQLKFSKPVLEGVLAEALYRTPTTLLVPVAAGKQ